MGTVAPLSSAAGQRASPLELLDRLSLSRARSLLAGLRFPLVAVAVVKRMSGHYVVIDGPRADETGRGVLRVASDPLIATARKTAKPIFWASMSMRRDVRAQVLSLGHGTTVPVHGPGDLMVLVSAVGRACVGFQESKEVPSRLREVGVDVLEDVQEQIGSMLCKGLTQLQRDTVRKLASGMRMVAIAQEEGVTMEAIVKRVESAKNVLGAETQGHLVALAMSAGEIGVADLEGL